MKLNLVGCSHHTTPLALRERIAFTDEQVAEALRLIRQSYPDCEAVLLSTCNRVELYVASPSAAATPGHSELIDFIAQFHHLSAHTILGHAIQYSDQAAMEHLFKVASSMDSLVVGETQILSQVKQAYETACQHQSAGPLVHSLFQHASHVAKRVSAETEIHHKRISVPSVAVSEIATDFFERLEDKQVLVIGSGEMAEEALRYLVDARAHHITIVNRSRDRADRLAAKHHATADDWSMLDHHVEQADLVISTTGATQSIMHLDRFQAILDRRKKGTILILDLAVPRDFEESIGRLSDVYVYAVDDLQRVCDRNAAWRRQQWPKAQKIIDEECERFWHNQKHRESVPAIQRLREQADLIKHSELDRLRGRLANHAVSDQAMAEIAQTVERVVNKILHPPLQSLREESPSDEHGSLLQALKRLFQLRD